MKPSNSFAVTTHNLSYSENVDNEEHSSSLRLVWEDNQGATPAKKKHFQEQLAAIITEVQEAERKIIGQELHDNVNQILTTVKLFADMMKPATEKDADLQKNISEYISVAINEIRKLSGELVAQKETEKGLPERVQALISDFLLATKIKIEFNHNCEVENLSREIKTTLLRIIQEQLNNIVKYSKAEQVWIDLRYCSNKAKLFIKDNGVGFDPKEVSHGIGFSNIADRAQSHHGSMYLQAAIGRGCVLSVSIPVI